jgi:hypothetical protein
MPYLITTSLYPSDKGPQVAEKYLEALKKYPPDENLGIDVVPAAVKATHQGIRVIGITEVKEGKLQEALNLTVNMMVMFQSIEGFEYTIDTYLKVEEALHLIGMSLPE